LSQSGSSSAIPAASAAGPTSFTVATAADVTTLRETLSGKLILAPSAA